MRVSKILVDDIKGFKVKEIFLLSSESVRRAMWCGMILAAVFLFQGCSEQDKPSGDHVENAKEYQDNGDLRAAVIELKNALTKAPDNAEARWLLGSIYVDVGNGVAAEKELLRAAELGVVDESINPLLIKARIYQQNYRSALEVALTNINGTEALAESYASRAYAYLGLEDINSAKLEIEKAKSKKADLLHVLVVDARVHAASGDIESAIETLQRALTQDGLYGPAWKGMGDMRQAQGDIEGAIVAYSRAIENLVDHAEDALKRAMLYTQSGDYDAAEKDIAYLRKRFPKHPGIAYVHGVLLFQQEKYQEAIPLLETAQKGETKEPLVEYYLAAAQYKEGNKEQAKFYIARFVAAVPYHVPGRKLYALLSLESNDNKAVEDMLRPLVKAFPDDVFSLNILANALLNTGKHDEAISLLKHVVDLQPDSAVAYTQLSIGLTAMGQRESGRKALQEAIEIDPKFHQADLLLVLSYLGENKFSEAQDVAERLVARMPENVVAHMALAQVFVAKGNIAAAEQSFLKLLEVSPNNIDAYLSLAKLALSQNDVSKAEIYHQKALDVDSNNIQLLMAISVFEKSQGNLERSLALLQQAVDAGDERNASVSLALAYIDSGKLDQAKLAINNVASQYKMTPEVLVALGSIKMAERDFEGARIDYGFLLDAAPNQVKSHYLLATAETALGNADKAISSLRTALNIVPNHVPAMFLLAENLLQKGELKQAQKVVDDLKVSVGENASVLRLSAGVSAAQNKHAEALALYQRAYDQVQDEKHLLALASYQWQQGFKDDVVQLLEAWKEKQGASVDVLLFLANSYIGSERYDDAIQQYQEVLRISKNNIVALSNLAWFMRERDLDQALAFAQKAAQEAPGLVTVIDTMSMIMLDKGDYERAKRFSERAMEHYPDDPTLIYHRALILDKSGDSQQAKDMLKTFLAKKPVFNELKEAEDMLKRLTD